MSYNNYPLTDWENKSLTASNSSSNEGYEDSAFKILAINQPNATGPFHINHFVSFFKMDPGWDFKAETKKLYTNFDSYFNNDLTKVNIHKDRWKGEKIAAFEISQSPINPHKDFVVLEQFSDEEGRQETVTGTTLVDTRDQSTIETLAEASAYYSSGFNNNFHFLSGRRSWKFGKLLPDNPFDNYYYFETAAIEKFSLPFYYSFDLNKNPPIIRSLVNLTWISMLKKFGRTQGIDLVAMQENTLDPSYPFDGMHRYSKDMQKISKQESVIYYRNESFAKSDDIATENDWFFSIMERHPGLYYENLPKHKG